MALPVAVTGETRCGIPPVCLPHFDLALSVLRPHMLMHEGPKTNRRGWIWTRC